MLPSSVAGRKNAANSNPAPYRPMACGVEAGTVSGGGRGGGGMFQRYCLKAYNGMMVFVLSLLVVLSSMLVVAVVAPLLDVLLLSIAALNQAARSCLPGTGTLQALHAVSRSKSDGISATQYTHRL